MDKFNVEHLDLYYGDFKVAQGYQPEASGQRDHRIIGTVRLR